MFCQFCNNIVSFIPELKPIKLKGDEGFGFYLEFPAKQPFSFGFKCCNLTFADASVS